MILSSNNSLELKLPEVILCTLYDYSYKRLYKPFDNSSLMTENSFDEMDIEAILDVMGCRTRREIITLLREEPRFVSQISKELEIGQKAIIEHLRAMESLGILRSSFKKIERGRPRKYYDMSQDITVNIIINQTSFEVDITEEALSRKQLPSGEEWSKLLNIEKRIRMGQWEAIEELKSLIRLYETLKKRAEDLLLEIE